MMQEAKDSRQASDPDTTSKIVARIISAVPVFGLAVLLAGSVIGSLPDWIGESSIASFYASLVEAFCARRPFVSKCVTGCYGARALRDFYREDKSLRFMNLDDQRRLFAAKYPDKAVSNNAPDRCRP